MKIPIQYRDKEYEYKSLPVYGFTLMTETFYGFETLNCDHSNYDDYFEKCTDCGMTLEELDPDGMTCEDCFERVQKEDGRFYKYEPSIWLCDSCHDERMEETV